MKGRLKLFGALGLLWVVFFEIARVIFLVYHLSLTSSLSVYEILMPLWLGLRMDLAMAAYWLVIPGLILTASFFIPERFSRWAITTVFYCLLIFSGILIVADLELYRHWGFRMDTTPLLYVGAEGLGSVLVLTLIWLVLIFLVLFIVMHLAFQKFVRPKLQFERGGWRSGILMFLVVALLFIPIRSSFRVAPLNTGVVYFHKTKSFPNHAGINVVWNFMRYVISDNSVRYPTNFLDQESTQKIFAELMQRPDSTIGVINNSRPNVLLIILESFTAKIVEPLGGKPGITPNLNRLCEEGILFDQFYASGDRTDKGLISILSGYPAQPKTSIIKYPNKTESLPTLPRKLSNAGYHTSFVYGGDIGFANMESYLNIAGFSHITQDDDFDMTLNVSKWGVRDEYVFEQLQKELDSARAPFFKTMLSLSSHEPFDVPGNDEAMDETTLFLNSCTYTDKWLGAFIDEARKKDWWKNTLVIITADHGHRLPGNNQVYDKEKFKIPMLWLGGAIDSAKRISKIGSQTDLAVTLLSQLGVHSDEFLFSKNLLSLSTQPFAVYSFHNGFGYIDPTMETIYDFDYRKYIKPENTLPEQELVKGKAFMQLLFTDYNKR
jgi:phosphoglycerol transferase MdoB-like AlkP superfamily enzyme